MKIIIKNLALVTMLAGTSLLAEVQSFMSLGYANVATQNNSSDGVSFNIGFKAGESFKHRVGLEYLIVNSDNNGKATLGNSADLYYTLGYEVFKSFTLNANIGYAYETVGSIGSGKRKVDIYATGMTYGGGMVYEFGKSIDLIAEYKTYQLAYDLLGVSLKKDKNVVTLALAYNF